MKKTTVTRTEYMHPNNNEFVVTRVESTIYGGPEAELHSVSYTVKNTVYNTEIQIIDFEMLENLYCLLRELYCDEKLED